MNTKSRHLINKNESREPLRPALREILTHISNQCIDCPQCKAECAFLKKYGTPGSLAQNFDPTDPKWLTLAYECSLCGLCAAVCPAGLKPEEMFLEMRREAVDRGTGPLPEHKRLLTYERRGASRRFSYYVIPRNCDTVFFPGCALTGARSEQTIGIYNRLKSRDPLLGMVLDCCCKPSHDLGRTEYFTAMNNELISYLTDHGVKKIITACPNCHKIFQSYADPIRVITVYETLLQPGPPENGSVDGKWVVSVHDPCVARSDVCVQDAVRKLAAEKGFACMEMPHSRSRTLCCGEGGNVEAVSPELANIWTKQRCDETDGRILLTYCAGCVNKLNQKTPTFHILDAILDPQSVISGKIRVSRPPWTYFNRLKVKRFLKKQSKVAVTRERIYCADP